VGELPHWCGKSHTLPLFRRDVPLVVKPKKGKLRDLIRTYVR